MQLQKKGQLAETLGEGGESSVQILPEIRRVESQGYVGLQSSCNKALSVCLSAPVDGMKGSYSPSPHIFFPK